AAAVIHRTTNVDGAGAVIGDRRLQRGRDRNVLIFRGQGANGRDPVRRGIVLEDAPVTDFGGRASRVDMHDTGALGVTAAVIDESRAHRLASGHRSGLLAHIVVEA